GTRHPTVFLVQALPAVRRRLSPTGNVTPAGASTCGSAEQEMSKRPSFFSTTVGSKVLIGLTGLLLFGFLITHLAGNLTMLSGGSAFNDYTYKLESTKPLLYVAEAGLLDRKSTRLNSSHVKISYAVFCLKT